jgi:hypothetical protein
MMNLIDCFVRSKWLLVLLKVWLQISVRLILEDAYKLI